jgi:hypothetical protein
MLADLIVKPYPTNFFVRFLTIAITMFSCAASFFGLFCDQKRILIINATRGIQEKNILKLRDHQAEARGSIVNQQIIRARAVTAELKLNIEKAHELRHTLRNLITIRRLTLEQIHGCRHRNLTNH